MQKLLQLLGEAVEFISTREHWANSFPLIAVAVTLSILGKELDAWFEAPDGVFSAAANVINLYLTLVVFSIAWYRAVVATGRVEMDYRPTRRAWRYILALIRFITFLMIPILGLFSISFVALGASGFPGSNWQAGLYLLFLPIIYLAIRLEFVMIAAANDRYMTVGEAWRFSGLVQWPLFAATVVVEALSIVPQSILVELQDAVTALSYLFDALSTILGFFVMGLLAAVSGLAYRKAMQIGRQTV